MLRTLKITDFQQVVRIRAKSAKQYVTSLKINGIAKGGVRNRNKGGCKHLFAFVLVYSGLLAFSPLRLLAFVSVCLRLFAFARLFAYAPLCRAPLCVTLKNELPHLFFVVYRSLFCVDTKY